MNTIYFDNNATTCVAPEVRDAMLPFFGELYGNPSSMHAFGGQVAAQALVAAGTTVEQPGRTVHSLHAYFLRAGSTTDHIVYMVDRLRDGRSFSTRRVRAVQYGKTTKPSRTITSSRRNAVALSRSAAAST